ncbi:hypothetical protein NE865_15035 [Phthorimaea operculella]|nr:hypothetical protein NE865_15035 [Phthorimaea operculella]
MNCKECSTRIDRGQLLNCSKCKDPYHYSCLNIDSAKYREHKQELTRTVKCHLCKNNTKISIGAKDQSPLPPQERLSSHMISQFTSLLDSRLKEFQTSFFDTVYDKLKTELTSTINLAISTLKKDFSETTDFLAKEQKDIKINIISAEQKIKQLETSNSQLQSEVRSLVQRINKCDVVPLKAQISKLECDLNNRAQASLLNEIEISGLQETVNENLHHTVQITAHKIGINLEKCDIDWISRVGPKQKSNQREQNSNFSADDAPSKSGTDEKQTVKQLPRPVVVRFTRKSRRDEFMRASKSRKDLTNEDVENCKSSQKIYINERLTKENRQLFRAARKYASQAEYKHTWTSNGNIFMRKGDGQFFPVIQIRTEADLELKTKLRDK